MNPARMYILLTANDKEGLKVLRHTASHVMAQAVQNLFPDAKTSTVSDSDHPSEDVSIISTDPASTESGTARSSSRAHGHTSLSSLTEHAGISIIAARTGRNAKWFR